ncbi:SH3 domain-binding glutamic acid-rich-like protein 2 isoform X4 [Pan paniscus]|uniref:SH3 domain-binding glutamic acid-rich-like protein 2 isoform X4 n=1 Tax=Pan paniscus TaxID=9597 RepID=UPI0015613C63|nr:SH3 domain-binding glutamic acid-rich-like protein 2 isoform X5 [Pan paniscus]
MADSGGCGERQIRIAEGELRMKPPFIQHSECSRQCNLIPSSFMTPDRLQPRKLASHPAYRLRVLTCTSPALSPADRGLSFVPQHLMRLSGLIHPQPYSMDKEEATRCG